MYIHCYYYCSFFGDELDGVNPFISFSFLNKQLLLLLLQASDTFS